MDHEGPFIQAIKFIYYALAQELAKSAATNSKGAVTILPRTVAPNAMPPPPALKAPPPNHAKVALVAAAPERPPIAVPVDAVPKMPTAP